MVPATQGAARVGSSGSPVFDAAHRVRGAMSCGPGGTPCPPNEFSTYGRFDLAFPIVQWYISNMSNPNFANRFVVGDPGEDGSSERGTQANPFKTVYKSTHSVPTGGTVRITPGNYNERFRLWRPMTLIPDGAGVVTIGAP